MTVQNPSGRLYVDNTILTSTAKCDTQVLLRHGYGLTSMEEFATLRSGTAAHEALAHFFRHVSKGKRPLNNVIDVIKDALTVLHQSYFDFAAEHVADDDRLAYRNVATILATYMQRTATNYQTLPYKVIPELIEIGFAFPLDDEKQLVLCGRLDALVESPQGDFYVLDHKTTGQLNQRWKQDFRLGSQFSGYQWAAQLHTKIPVVGTYINGIEFSQLPSDPVRKCKVHGLKYQECGPQHAKFDLSITTRSPAQIAGWQHTATRLGRKFKRLLERYPEPADVRGAQQQGQFIKECGWCEFREFCAGGRNVKELRALYRYEPWRPFEYAMEKVGAGK